MSKRANEANEVMHPKSSSSMRPSSSGQPSMSIQPSLLPSTKPSSSMRPSSSPSFDPRPTLEIVQKRGHVLCGLSPTTIETGEGFYLDLCRSVAAVLFGNPDNFVEVRVSSADRFLHLHSRPVDLLLSGDTHTTEREVRERTTGAGFTFSSPYYYDGMAYLGNQSFVNCAEQRKRSGKCSSLLLCIAASSSHYDYIMAQFPSEFFKLSSSLEETKEMLFNGSCNVMASDRSFLLRFASGNDTPDGKFIVGDKMMTKEPLAIVTRNDNHEFSDIINWVVHALFYGEELGLTKNPTLCQNYTNLTSRISDLSFLNAVYCVGNYGEILFDDEKSNRGMNQINNGTTGMIYATPFGKLLESNDGFLTDLDVSPSGTLLGKIRNEVSSLNCGVIVPDGFNAEITKSGGLVGMSVDYCRALAAALFHGASGGVNLFVFSGYDNSSLAALDNGTVDVLAGGRVEWKYDFESSPSLGGFHFSTPYYYGNETASDDVSFFSLATREDDVLFSSFVNCIVLATIFAQENFIMREKSEEMPLISFLETSSSGR